ncbi:uncharacterized protein LOC129287781 [Prosopis cineraria]|uniref:uncharacterized protein LOC129287781 n=1 Tax=Prosopis cineraria TaxID=364024 RepID=UPI00240FE069|nr:uncharacterized protein LOC129287781 [Prosopis cineraria]
MNTKTMRLPPRRVLTPGASPHNNNKRKEREEGFDRPKPSPSNTPTTLSTSKLLKLDKPRAGFEPPRYSVKGLEPTKSNQLLAGFLAHEFLTKGTLFGEPWDPARAAEGPTEADKRKGKSSQIGEGEPASRRAEPEKQGRYAELADLMRASGTHVPGIVNPTQLSRFLHL